MSGLNANTDTNANSNTNLLNYMKAIFYFVAHLIVAMFALYLSFTCNNNSFNLVSVFFAFFFPWFYIIYAMLINQGCGLLPKSVPKT